MKSQYTPEHEEIHEICASALLSISARARAKGREGTKTNKGALFARLNDVVDVEAAMKRETDEVGVWVSLAMEVVCMCGVTLRCGWCVI